MVIIYLIKSKILAMTMTIFTLEIHQKLRFNLQYYKIQVFKYCRKKKTLNILGMCITLVVHIRQKKIIYIRPVLLWYLTLGCVKILFKNKREHFFSFIINWVVDCVDRMLWTGAVHLDKIKRMSTPYICQIKRKSTHSVRN